MKGTLFSADFITDLNDNLRLLEINTDVGFISSAFPNFDFTELISVLSSNSITKFHVVHKSIQTEFVQFLSQSLNSYAPFVTQFDTTYEEVDSIYPSAVTDESDKFILRLCYDESALLDSVYAKNNVELFKLFLDNNNSGSIAEFSYNSETYSYDNLSPSSIFNTGPIPDVVVKNTLTSINTPLLFYKAGQPELDEQTRLDSFINSIKTDYPSSFIQKFYDTGTTHSTSIRNISIVYGSNLDVTNIATYEADAILSKPVSLEVDNTLIANQLGIQHYFEFATNDTKLERGGVFEGQYITDATGSAVLISDVQIGDIFKSYIVSGSPDSDDINTLAKWSFPGSTIPSGSYETTSTLVNISEFTLKFNLVSHIVLSNGSSFKVAPAELLLVYDVQSDKILYKMAAEVSTTDHKLFDYNGDLIDITTSEIEVHNGVHKAYELDLEDADTFFIETGIGGPSGWVKILTHNCFVEGTQIYTSEGYKPVENFLPGDEIVTYDNTSKKIASGTVKKVHRAKVNTVIELTFSNGTQIKTTRQHPYYVENKGWVLAKDLVKGDTCLDKLGNTVLVESVRSSRGEYEVFNLHNVVPNHTFFANDILVHNKICFVEGTEVLLGNGEIKLIEKVEVGDIVLTFNENTKALEPNRVLELFSPAHDDLVTLKLSNGRFITSTYDHPYYTVDNRLASRIPSITKAKYELGKEIVELKEGTILFNSKLEEITVVSIEDGNNEKPTQTYTLKVENNHNFFANNILVHNKL